MAGQGLFLRSFKLVSNNRFLFNNRITNVNVQLSAMGLKQDSRERLKQLNIPEKPKRPLTPYVKFVADHREEILKMNPDIKPKDIIKKCAEDWKNVSKEDKSKYTEAFNLEREAYEVKVFKFNETLTAEQKEAIKYMEEEKKEDRRKRKLRKIYKETSKPKKPMGVFMRYLVEQGKMRNKPVKDLMSELSKSWSMMSDDEKLKYHNLYVSDYEKYKKALKEWEARMVKEGREDLIRMKTLDEKRLSKTGDSKKGNPL